MSDFFRSKGFKVLVAVFVLLFGMMISSLLRNGVAGTVDGVVGVVVTPVRTVTSSLGNLFSGIGKSFENRSELQKQVDALTQENAELLGQIADYEETKRENEQLRELVDLQERNQDTQFASASVISRDREPWSNTIGLDKGTLDGISVGDPVITKDNFLVGWVSKAGATWCTVTTILDVTSNVGVQLSSSREAGIAECTVELAAQSLCRVSYLPRESAVSRGELVITSGLSGYYPEGLILGRVDAIFAAEDGLSSQVTVTPAADMDSIKDVFVITDFPGQGVGVGQ